ncbi:chemotaxis protein CheW [Halobellus clavatus]|jgi:purine-binding chemotaxis protein CheW|uniref:Purine-binding chemotaxis protein CheW n=1 Tax=Halobellus clavatus TaxID=660517 RepID=A0A1H3HX53_9EURY|nr:chemotaxis protein CheW [Halobellus clavatus]SDY20036.1 purine-binding chemotaxis protein CheW [Halobellus clavatus]
MSQEQTAAAGASAPTATDDTDATARKMQVLEFELGGETYCVDIDYVSEIVDRGSLTAVPNAPEFVEGVMDLRGRTTSIVNPKTLLNVEDTGEASRIVIFDASKFKDDAAVGWLVDEVDQVVRVSMDDVEDPPMERGEFIEGIVRREEGLVVWISPTSTTSN